MSGLFLPSMIEVEFGEYYRSCAELLFKNGFKSFHIDFGDKKLIGRELECWDKVLFLQSLGADVKLTAHIMSMSGRHPLSVENIASRCIDEGFEIIYIHARSFENFDKLIKFKEIFFKELHHIFGIVSELQSEKNQNLLDFAKSISLVNLLQMGVPIGRGGQKFSWDAIDRIQDFIFNCSTLNNIELDGGLTLNIVKELNKVSINRFAGWSIISDKNPKNILSNALEVEKIII